MIVAVPERGEGSARPNSLAGQALAVLSSTPDSAADGPQKPRNLVERWLLSSLCGKSRGSSGRQREGIGGSSPRRFPRSGQRTAHCSPTLSPNERQAEVGASPGGPGGPLGPAGPWAPFAPGAPCGPAGPTLPSLPWGPAGPAGPVAPASPWAPGRPLSPFGPTGPGSPCGPAGPSFSASCVSCSSSAVTRSCNFRNSSAGSTAGVCKSSTAAVAAFFFLSFFFDNGGLLS